MTISNIYDLHRAAFSNVSAYVVMKNGERVATIAFKFPRDGAGRLYAYVHWIGVEMVRGFAGGYGYDKRSAACSSAAKRIVDPIRINSDTEWMKDIAAYDAFRGALTPDDGHTWDSRLRTAGFDVVQAV